MPPTELGPATSCVGGFGRAVMTSKTGGRSAGCATQPMQAPERPRGGHNRGDSGATSHDGARICWGFRGLENEKSSAQPA